MRRKPCGAGRCRICAATYPCVTPGPYSLATVAEMGLEGAAFAGGAVNRDPTPNPAAEMETAVPPASRSRDATTGRFKTRIAVNIEAVRFDYESDELSTVEVAIRHEISASTLHRLVVQHGWRPRAPHRIDPDDLIMRMFAALDAQMRDLESTMTNAGGSHAGMLVKLVGTLDKLIEIKDAEARKHRDGKRPSRRVLELRSKLAQRVAELNED